MSDKVNQLLGYVQERCLWQFFSRSKDRKENIDGIIAKATDLLTGKELSLETPMDKLFYADAKIMVSDFKQRFPWIETSGPAQIREVMQQLKDRLIDVAITSSKNDELNHSLY
jgi:nitrogenase delta subunit